jgi:hypothetical protein
MDDRKADCEALLNWLFPLAEELLEESAQFFPFGGAMTPDGTLVSVAGHDEGEEPPPAELAGLIKAAFVEGAARGAFKATALIYDARVALSEAEATSHAIVAELNHRGRYSVTVLFPYRIEGGVLVIEAPDAELGAYDIFPQA